LALLAVDPLLPNPQVPNPQAQKKKPSAVAGEGFSCFGAQVGAGPKTVRGFSYGSDLKDAGHLGEPRGPAEGLSQPSAKDYFFLVVFFVVFLVVFFVAFLAAFFIAMVKRHLLS
jgi:hypothetical protein